MLGNLHYKIDEETAVTIYKTYIRPVLEQGLYTLDSYRKDQISCLQKIQNRALRLCYKTSPFESAFPLRVQAKLLRLDLRKKAILLGIINIKLIKGDNNFVFAKSDSRSRSGTRLMQAFPNYERYKGRCAIRAPKYGTSSRHVAKKTSNR